MVDVVEIVPLEGVGHLFISFALISDQRIEFRCGLAHQLHRQSISFRLVLHLPERRDDVLKDLVRVSEIAVRVGDRYTECIERFLL